MRPVAPTRPLGSGGRLQPSVVSPCRTPPKGVNSEKEKQLRWEKNSIKNWLEVCLPWGRFIQKWNSIFTIFSEKTKIKSEASAANDRRGWEGRAATFYETHRFIRTSARVCRLLRWFCVSWLSGSGFPRGGGLLQMLHEIGPCFNLRHHLHPCDMLQFAVFVFVIQFIGTEEQVGR